eukprot:TRINITY_DN3684_c0_g1_i1.p1 TRINITY_DN3684_c0_g1~~TRINITY_DN3684_c0_g1_i1.p1  ORF type:complete len:261 (-),score=23.73 TRINITY_DN3684_c0_g1_i1:186-968(-)
MPVAVKKWHMDERQSPEQTKLFIREIECNKNCNHPNVARCFGGCTEPVVAMVMEFCEGADLYHFLHSRSVYTFGNIQDFALRMARGMAHVHERGIVHRDLKSTNFLVNREGDIKVCDFGLGRIAQLSSSLTMGRGSARWVAPEVLQTTHYDKSADVYSFGVVLWELCTRRLPYDEYEDARQVLHAVVTNQRLEIPRNIPPIYAEIMKQCWGPPERRPDFKTIIRALSGRVVPQEYEMRQLLHGPCRACKVSAPQVPQQRR